MVKHTPVVDECLDALSSHAFVKVRGDMFRSAPVPALVGVEIERFTRTPEARRDLRVVVGGPHSRLDGDALSDVVADFVMSQQDPCREPMYDLRSPVDRAMFVEDFHDRFLPIVALSADPAALAEAIVQGSVIPFGAKGGDLLATARPLLEIGEAYRLERPKREALRLLIQARDSAATAADVEELQFFVDAWQLGDDPYWRNSPPGRSG